MTVLEITASVPTCRQACQGRRRSKTVFSGAALTAEVMLEHMLGHCRHLPAFGAPVMQSE